MAIDYAALKTEILTDPNNYGYAGPLASRTDWQVAALLNEIRAGITVPRADVTPLEVIEAINVSDFVTSPASTLYASWLSALLQYPSLRILKADGSDTRVMSNVMKLLTNGSASETRLRALASRTGSRAEQLFGVGTVVAVSDIGTALAS